jgi:hypothetical protein
VVKSVTYLFDVVEVGLHALDGDLFVGLDLLGLQHLGEGALSLLAYQPVFYQ